MEDLGLYIDNINARFTERISRLLNQSLNNKKVKDILKFEFKKYPITVKTRKRN